MLLSYERAISEVKCRSAVLHILEAAVNSLTSHCFIESWQESAMTDSSDNLLTSLLNTFCYDIDLKVSNNMLPLLITDVYVNALFIKWSGWLIYFGKLRIFLLEKCQINCIFSVTSVLVSFKFI